MVDIEPYEYQRKTNLKEHNDLVAKINEIVDVINNTNLDTILPKISKLETDVNTIKATDSLQWTDIENLKTKNTEYDTHFGLNDTQIADINKSLVSDVALMNGTTTGNVKVRIGRNDAPSIDSDDYNIQKPTSIELVQGSAPAMVKAQITLSDRTVLISDDFMFTTEAIGQDVYISSFVFKNGNVAGTISADIGLSNGSTLTANNFAVPTDPNVSSAISDLQTRMTAVEGGSVGELDELKAQVQTNTSNIGTLTTEIDNLDIQKADQSNPAQTIKADTTDLRTVKLRDSTDAVGSYLQFNADANKPVRMEYYNGTEVVDSGFVATVDGSGNPKNFTIPSGGEVWEEVNLSNFPTNWVAGDRIKVSFNIYLKTDVVSSWSTAPQVLTITGIGSGSYKTPLIEIEIDSSNKECSYPIHLFNNNNKEIDVIYMTRVNSSASFNSGTLFSLRGIVFNGAGASGTTYIINKSTINFIYKMWRLKK